MKKHPMTWLFLLGVINLLGGLTAWRFVDYYVDSKHSYNIIFGVYLGLSSLVWLFILFRLGDKFWKAEEKGRVKNFEKKLKTEKPIVLAVKRNIFANCSLIFGATLLYVLLILLFPSPKFLGIGYTIARIVAALWFIYGLVFSLFVYKKKVVFENGKFTIMHTEGQDIVASSEIVKTRLSSKESKRDDPVQYFFTAIEIELSDGRVLTCDKADTVMSFDKKIKAIQNYWKKKMA